MIEKENLSNINFEDLISEIINTEKKIELASPDEKIILEQKLENLKKQVNAITSRLDKIETYLKINNQSHIEKSDEVITEKKLKESDIIINKRGEYKNIVTPSLSAEDSKKISQGIYAYIFLSYMENKKINNNQMWGVAFLATSSLAILTYLQSNFEAAFQLFIVMSSGLLLLKALFSKNLNKVDKQAFERLANHMSVNYTTQYSQLEMERARIFSTEIKLREYVNLLKIKETRMSEKDLEKKVKVQKALGNKEIEEWLFKFLNIRNGVIEQLSTSDSDEHLKQKGDKNKIVIPDKL